MPGISSLQLISGLEATCQPHTPQTNASCAPIRYKELTLPPIAGFDSNPLYHVSGQTNQSHIYITMGNDSGLKVYQYNIDTNEWREFYDFGYAVQCSYIGNAVDSLNNQLYVISKCTNSLRTMLCGLDLNTKQFIFKKVMKKQYEKDSQHLLVSIPSGADSNSSRPRSSLASELHLLYSSSINHMRIDVNPSRFSSKYKEYDGIEIDRLFNNGARLSCAKSIYIPSVRRIFVFGGKPHEKHHSELLNSKHDRINCTDPFKDSKNEIAIPPNEGYYTTEAVSNSIWYCDINDLDQADDDSKNYKWRIYKQRLPHKTSDYGVLNAFGHYVFLFYYNTDNSIWCLNLLSGAMAKCNQVFPLNCFEEMRMISTADNHAHFMLINKDYGWLRCRMYGFKRYVNKLTGETIWHEPKIWMDWDEDNIDPRKRCNFHISFDLLDVVPQIIRQTHRQRTFDLITGLMAQHMDPLKCDRFAMDLIHLIGGFTSRLYYRG